MQNAPKWVSGLTAALKFLPLAVFAVLVIVFKLDLLLAAPIATFAAVVVFLGINGNSFEAALKPGIAAAGKIVLIFFILMFAYGVAECFMATGVGAALINIALSVGVTGRSVAPIAIVVTCLLSIATGSSWGTFAACAPIFLWLNHIVGGNSVLTVCAIAGGSCFGDNIGMISDVTVLSCGAQDVKIIDRVKHQSVWSFGCLVIAIFIFFIMSINLPSDSANVAAAIERIPASVYDALAVQRPSAVILLEQVKNGVPIFMVLPMIVVIVMSFFGVHTLLCLGAGMISSLICGTLAGTTDISSWLTMLFNGFSDAGSWTIIMMLWVAAFGGIMNAMNAFEPLAKLIVRFSKNVHQLMGWCGVLCLIGNMALADETAQVATMSPIIREIVEKNVKCKTEEDAYVLRLRLATFTSAMGIYGSELVPWHCFPVFFTSIANAVYPLQTFSTFDIISKNYMSFLIIGSVFILSFTGWDRFVPKFALPEDVELCRCETARRDTHNDESQHM